MPKRAKGRSHSTRPVSKRPPVWCRYQTEEVEALIVRLAKEGRSVSNIGIILRDQYGIPLVKPIIGKSISRVLKDLDLLQSPPEDLEMLMQKAKRMHTHLEKNEGDKHNKRALQLTENKIYKLSRYYRKKGILPPDWRYEVSKL